MPSLYNSVFRHYDIVTNCCHVYFVNSRIQGPFSDSTALKVLNKEKEKYKSQFYELIESEKLSHASILHERYTNIMVRTSDNQHSTYSL